jgi:hypothetical protein
MIRIAGEVEDHCPASGFGRGRVSSGATKQWVTKTGASDGESFVTSFLKKLLVKISGNELAQKILEKNVLISQRYMGIGSGAPVDESGEFAAIKKLKELKRTNYCIFDIGANQGQFVSLISSYFQEHKNYQVHCFEPCAYAFGILSQKLAGNNNVILNNKGLGEKRGELELF